MTPERWQQIKELLESLLEQAPEQRAAYLDRVCLDDPGLRKEAESLLKFEEQGDSGFEETISGRVSQTASRMTGETDSVEVNAEVQEEEFNGNGRFIIECCLGKGGFGIVYRAYDRERKSVKALKTLNRILISENANALYRFKQEFRALADIIHPNLVTLYELISDGKQWFFTMELIDGINFLEYVRSGTNPAQIDYTDESTNLRVMGPDNETNDETVKPGGDQIKGQEITAFPPLHLTGFRLNLNRLRAAFRQLVEGICALHQAGKLHRDIKPSNVLVTKEGRVVILDFGLVTELTIHQSLDQIAGTPAYMSPEQAKGLAVTEASDWYSVGVMLFQALTGQLPFTGHMMDVLMKKQKFEPPAPRDLLPNVPEDLDSLCRELLRIDPKVRPSGQEIVHRLEGPLTEATSSSITSSSSKRSALLPLIGRESHLTVLRDAFLTIKQGHAATVYVQGRSGMGKSTLVNHFLEELQQNNEEVLILAGRCYEQESVPYKALDSVIDALSRYLKRLAVLEAEAFLPLDILALARLFPILQRVKAVAGVKRKVLEIPDSQELRRRAFVALRELLARLANRKGLVLFIDDLQWGDLDSAALLGELLRPPDPPALLLIGSYRSEEVTTSLFLKTLLSSQESDGSNINVRKVIVEELSPSESQELILALSGEHSTSAARAELIGKECGGNPFFIQELVCHLQTDGERLESSDGSTKIRNSKLDEVIQVRVSSLPEEARRLLEVVAVAGQPVERSVASSAAELSMDESKMLALLRAGHMIRTTGATEREEIETYHDRIRETVVLNLSPDLMKAHHYHLALSLEDSGRSDPERLALHFQEGGDSEKAAKYAVIAAEQAAKALAFDHAARLYKLAFELESVEVSDTKSLRIKLAEALANAGRGAEAAKEYLIAAEQTGGTEATELERRAAEQFLISGHINDGVPILRDVLQKKGINFPKTAGHALATLLYRRSKLRLRGLNYKERTANISPEELAKIDTCWSAGAGLFLVDGVNSASLAALHSILALDCGEPFRVMKSLQCEASYSAFFGRKELKRSNEILQMIFRLEQRLNDPIATAYYLLARLMVTYFSGRWREAIECGKQGEEILRRHGSGLRWEMVQFQIFLLNGLFFSGEIRELSDRLYGPLKEAQDRNDILIETYLRAMFLYRILLASDRPDEAETGIFEVIEKWPKEGFQFPHWWCVLGRVCIALYLGEGRRAWQLINEQWNTFTRSFFYRCQVTYIFSYHLHAYSAIAAAREESTKEGLLRVAEKDAKKIERENMKWSYPFARAIWAGICMVRGDNRTALEMLERAEGEFRGVDMQLYGAAAKRRRGGLIGGDEGRNMIREADEWMSGQRIKNPERMTNLLIPGKI